MFYALFHLPTTHPKHEKKITKTCQQKKSYCNFANENEKLNKISQKFGALFFVCFLLNTQFPHFQGNCLQYYASNNKEIYSILYERFLFGKTAKNIVPVIINHHCYNKRRVIKFINEEYLMAPLNK